MRPNATDSSQFKHVQKTQNFPVSSQTGLAFPYLHPLAHVNMREHAKKNGKAEFSNSPNHTGDSLVLAISCLFSLPQGKCVMHKPKHVGKAHHRLYVCRWGL